MSLLENYFHWLATTHFAWSQFFTEMMNGAEAMDQPVEFDFKNVVEVDFSRKGE